MNNQLAQALLEGVGSWPAPNSSLADILAGAHGPGLALIESKEPINEQKEENEDIPLDPRADADSKRRAEKIIQALSKGEIPQELCETWRLADPGSAASRVFQVTLEKFAREIYSRFHDFDKEPVRFLLASSKEQNAFRVKNANPPMIVFNRSLFLPRPEGLEPVIATPDDLALVLIHELTHLEKAKRYGDKVKNSKFEEAAAYVRPLAIMHDAGLNPERATYTYNKLLTQKRYFDDDLVWQLADPHPLDEHIKRMTIDALAVLRKERGELRPKQEAAPFGENHGLIVTVNQSTHESYLRHELRRNYPEYNQATGAIKLQILNQIFLDMQDYYPVRLVDLATEIECLADDIDRTRDQPAIDKFVEDVINRYEAHPRGSNPILYKALAQLVEPEIESAPLGRLAAISSLVGAAIQAVRSNDSSKIIESCEALMHGLRNEPLYRTEHGRSFLQSISFPRFKFPDTDAIYRKQNREELIRDMRKNYGRNKSIEELADYLDPGEEDTFDEVEVAQVEWQPMRILAQKHLAVAEAGFALGLGWDAGFHEALNSHEDLAIYLYSRGNPEFPNFPQIAPDFSDISVSLRHFAIDKDGTPSNFDPVSDRSGTESCFRVRVHIKRDLIARYFLEAESDQKSKEKLFELAKEFGEVGAESSSAYLLRKQELLCLDVAEKGLALFQELNFFELSRSRDAQWQLFKKFSELLNEDKDRFAPIIRREFYRIREDGVHLNPLLRRIIEDSDKEKFAPIISAFEREPLIVFVLRDSFNIFSAEEKYQLLEANFTPSFNDTLELADHNTAAKLLAALGPLSVNAGRVDPGTISDFETLNKALVDAKSRSQNIQLEIIDNLPAFIRDSLINFEAAILSLRAIQMFEQKKPQITEFLEFVALIGPQKIARMEPFKIAARKWLSAEITKHGLPEDTAEAIDAWCILTEAELITAEERDKLTAELTSRINSEKSVDRRIEYVSALFGENRILSPKSRFLLVNLWAQGVLEKLGIDDGSPAYQTKISTYIEHISEQANRIDMRELFSALAKEVEAQSAVCKTLHKQLHALSEEDLKHAPLKGILSETAVYTIRNSKRLRNKTLEFLLSPLSQDALQSFAQEMNEIKEIMSEENRIQGIGLTSDEMDAEIDRFREIRFISASRHLYENFWAAPLGARAIIAKELLIGPADEGHEIDESIFSYALSKAFPQDSEDAEKAKQVVRLYIKVLPYYQRHLALAALSVAAERTREDGISIGEALASVLENMGPAEVVAGQNASSHSGVPFRIAEPLLRLKYLADQPERWDLIHWVESIRPDLEKQYSREFGKDKSITIAHCGKLVGSASICVDIRLALSNGRGQILAIRRPYAEARADAGFASMKLLVNELGQSDAVAKTLDELIDQSRGRLSLETNCLVAPLQYALGQEIYKGLQVTVDDEVFYFSSAAVTAAGEITTPKGEKIGYFSMDEIPGSHFLELPERTPKQLAHKKRIALALTVVELSNMLKGKFDCDRHGGQVKIQRNNIGHYDFKAMALKEWDTPGFEQLARILTNFPFASPSIEGISAQMLSFQREMRAKGQSVHPYVVEVQKALLSIGDFTRYLDQKDLRCALLSALASGVHPDLERALIQAMPPPARPILQGLLKRGELPAGIFGDLKQSDLVRLSRM